MASLPIVKTLDDCIDFSKTVSPYWPHLLSLPTEIARVLPAYNQLIYTYTSTNPLMTGLAFALFLGLLFSIAGEINKNYSQVDRFWSILPTVFIGHFTLYAHLVGLNTERLDLLLGVSALWSVSFDVKPRSR